MKVKVSFIPSERERASEAVEVLKQILAEEEPQIRYSDRHPPYRHVYISTKNRSASG